MNFSNDDYNNYKNLNTKGYSLQRGKRKLADLGNQFGSNELHSRVFRAVDVDSAANQGVFSNGSHFFNYNLNNLNCQSLSNYNHNKSLSNSNNINKIKYSLASSNSDCKMDLDNYVNSNDCYNNCNYNNNYNYEKVHNKNSNTNSSNINSNINNNNTNDKISTYKKLIEKEKSKYFSQIKHSEEGTTYDKCCTKN